MLKYLHLKSGLLELDELIEFYRIAKGFNDYPSTQYTLIDVLLLSLGYEVLFPTLYHWEVKKFLTNFTNFARLQTDQKKLLLEIDKTKGYFTHISTTDFFLAWHYYLADKFKETPVVDFYLNKINNLIIKKNIKTFFVSAPIHPKEDISKKFFRYKRDVLKTYQQSIMNIELISTPPSWEKEYFHDALHLNNKGAQRLSILIKNDKRIQASCL